MILSRPLYERQQVVVDIHQFNEKLPHLKALGIKSVTLFGPMDRMPWGDGVEINVDLTFRDQFVREVDGFRFNWYVEYPSTSQEKNDWTPSAQTPLEVIPHLPYSLQHDFVAAHLKRLTGLIAREEKTASEFLHSAAKFRKESALLVEALHAVSKEVMK